MSPPSFTTSLSTATPLRSEVEQTPAGSAASQKMKRDELAKVEEKKRNEKKRNAKNIFGNCWY